MDREVITAVLRKMLPYFCGYSVMELPLANKLISFLLGICTIMMPIDFFLGTKKQSFLVCRKYIWKYPQKYKIKHMKKNPKTTVMYLKEIWKYRFVLVDIAEYKIFNLETDSVCT